MFFCEDKAKNNPIKLKPYKISKNILWSCLIDFHTK